MVVKLPNLLEGEFQDQGQIDQYFEDWLSPRGSQYVHGFFSEEYKKESIRIEYLDPEGSISTMVVIKWSDAIRWPRVKIDGPQCGGLYKEDHESIIPWSGTDPDSKMNYFTWSTEENDWIVLRYQ